MNARITLVGMNNEVKAVTGHEINSTWGVSSESYDNDVMLETIIRKGGRFEPLYTDPIYFDAQCAIFWRKWYRTFDKWFTVFDKEYEPLWDRNGYEEIHEDTFDKGTNDTITKNKEVIDDDTTANSTEVMDDDTTANSKEVMDDDTTENSSEVMADETTANSKEVIDDDTTENSTEVMADETTFGSTEVMDDDTTGHTENKVSAFDSSEYSPHDESDTRGTDDRTTTTNSNGTDDRTTNKNSTGTDDRTTTTTSTGTDDRNTTKNSTGTDDRTTTTTSTGTDDRTTTTNSTGTDDRTTNFDGNIDNDTTNDRDFDHTLHSWGNWGISQTSQKLLEQELKVQAWNIYDHIADIFCKELLITVF